MDDRHTGTASGFDSAIARTGGLVATALAGAVMAVPAAEVADLSHAAALIAALFAAAAGAIAFLALRPDGPAAKTADQR